MYLYDLVEHQNCRYWGLLSCEDGWHPSFNAPVVKALLNGIGKYFTLAEMDIPVALRR